MKAKKYIAVFCSAAELDEKYVKHAEEFAQEMARQGYHLVWGASNTGLMKTVADGVEKGGGELVGVSIDVFQAVIRPNATEIIMATSLGERKATMLMRADAIVVLVGGIGTLDEVTEVIELRKQGKHTKPIVFLNTDKFYEGLLIQLKRMKEEGFLHKPLEDIIYFADTVDEAMDYINEKLGV